MMTYILSLALLFLFSGEALASSGNTISYAQIITFSWSEAAKIADGNLQTDDNSRWRLMDTGPEEYNGTMVILNAKGSREGIAYFDEKRIPVTLLSGEPDLNEGFRTALLLADREQRRLLLTDGTTRRVLDSEVDLNFSASSLVEIIITRDRRYAIDLNRALRIAISPPMSN